MISCKIKTAHISVPNVEGFPFIAFYKIVATVMRNGAPFKSDDPLADDVINRVSDAFREKNTSAIDDRYITEMHHPNLVFKWICQEGAEASTVHCNLYKYFEGGHQLVISGVFKYAKLAEVTVNDFMDYDNFKLLYESTRAHVESASISDKRQDFAHWLMVQRLHLLVDRRNDQLVVELRFSPISTRICTLIEQGGDTIRMEFTGSKVTVIINEMIRHINEKGLMICCNELGKYVNSPTFKYVTEETVKTVPFPIFYRTNALWLEQDML